MKTKTVYCRECGIEICSSIIGRSVKGRKYCQNCIAGILKRHPGDENYEVEWCVDLPLIEGTNDADIDSARYRREYVNSKEHALELAKRVLKEDKLGAVRITLVRWEDQYPDTEFTGKVFGWEPIGDSVEISE